MSAGEATIYVALPDFTKVENSKLHNITARAHQNAKDRNIYINLRFSVDDPHYKSVVKESIKLRLVNLDGESSDIYLTTDANRDFNNSIEANYEINTETNGILDFLNKDILLVRILDIYKIFN